MTLKCQQCGLPNADGAEQCSCGASLKAGETESSDWPIPKKRPVPLLQNDKVLGFAMIGAGVLTLIITYSLASPGGIYLAPTGLILAGLFKVSFDSDRD